MPRRARLPDANAATPGPISLLVPWTSKVPPTVRRTRGHHTSSSGAQTGASVGMAALGAAEEPPCSRVVVFIAIYLAEPGQRPENGGVACAMPPSGQAS